MTKEIKIKSLTYSEFDEYQDYMEKLADEGYKENKISRMAASWIMDKIYKIDTKTTTLTPGKVMDIVAKTVEATLKVEEEEEKN